MSQTKIRPYQPSDLEACIEIFKSNMPTFFFEHELPMFRAYLEKHGLHHYWCILENDRVVGCGGYFVDESGQSRLCWGLIEHRHHHRGFGRKLVEFRINELLKNPKVVSIGLDTSQHNPEFFKKFGFQEVSVTPDKYGPGLHSHEMILKVKRDPNS